MRELTAGAVAVGCFSMLADLDLGMDFSEAAATTAFSISRSFWSVSEDQLTVFFMVAVSWNAGGKCGETQSCKCQESVGAIEIADEDKPIIATATDQLANLISQSPTNLDPCPPCLSKIGA